MSASVLLVDDEADIRYLARLQLGRDDGFDVVGEAADGLEAVDLASRFQPDVVLLDVMMPHMDGYTALPAILTASPRSMVVMVSALDAVSNQSAALAAGAVAYLEKDAIVSGLAEVLADLHTRFRRTMPDETVRAPEARPPVSSATAPATSDRRSGAQDGSGPRS